ncbi:hypothetical protein D3C72_2342810 [compost metagenome]
MAVAEGLLLRLATERQQLAIGCGYARGYIARCVSADSDPLRRLWKRFKAASLRV